MNTFIGVCAGGERAGSPPIASPSLVRVQIWCAGLIFFLVHVFILVTIIHAYEPWPPRAKVNIE